MGDLLKTNMVEDKIVNREEKIIKFWNENYPSTWICKEFNIKRSDLNKIRHKNFLEERNRNAVRRRTLFLEGKKELIQCPECNNDFIDLFFHLKRIHKWSNDKIEEIKTMSDRTKTDRRKSHIKKFKKNPKLRKICAKNGRKNITKVNESGLGWKMPVGYHTEKHKQKIKDLMTGRKVTWKDKIKKSHLAHNEKKREEVIQKIRSKVHLAVFEGRCFTSGFKNGAYSSKKTGEKEFYQSSYELKRMKELDNDDEVLMWTKRHYISIPYFNKEGIQKKYIPDFFIEMKSEAKIIEEVKGFIHKGNEDVNRLKIQAAKNYCLTQDYQYIFNLSFLDKKRRVLWEKKLKLK